MEIEKRLRLSILFHSLGIGFFSPFVTLFAVSLGASSFYIGLISSLNALVSSFFNLIFLPIFPFLKNKIRLYITLMFLAGLLYLPIAYVNDVKQLMILVAIQSGLFAISSVIWNTIVISSFPKWRRGKEIGLLTTFSTVGSLVSYIVGGIVIRMYGFLPYLFYSSFFSLSVLSNVFLLKIKTDNRKESKVKISEVLRNKRFLKFLAIMWVFNFSVGIGSPLFNLYLIKRLNANSLELSFVSTITLLVFYLFSESVGKACDFLGKRMLLFFSLPFITFFPLLYVMGKTMTWIYIVTFICQLGWVAFNTSTFLYLSEMVEGGGASYRYFAIYNFLIGISSVLSNFLAGYFSTLLTIESVLILSSILRLFSSFLFLLLERGNKPVTSLLISPYSYSRYVNEFFTAYSFIMFEVKKSRIEKLLSKIGKLFK